MRVFTPEQCDALFDAILVNDVVGAPAALPAVICTDYPADRLADGFALSRQLWREGFDPVQLSALAARLGREGDLDAADRLSFKHIRAKFKHLRFAFVLYGADHVCPPVFKGITTSMGHLQDASRTGHRGAVARHAALLRLLLTRLPRRAFEREANRIVPTDSAGFRRFTLAQVGALSGMLRPDTITGHAFHAARKIVSRQVSFHDDMRVLHPAPEHDAMSRYLSAINGLMGQFHDDLVLGKVQGDLNYARGAFALPDDIRTRLTALVEQYPPA